jgi:Domain of unknown function (DUF3291)
MHLAQINVGRLLHPIDDPRIAEFVDSLDRVNALAERSPGFVWRMKDESGNATQMALYDDPLMIVNMSVWESVEALHGFAYQTIHRRFVQRRREWFEPFGAAYMALWWVDEGTIPEIGEGQRRLAHLERFGPTAYAFGFTKRFPPASGVAPLDEVGDGRTAPERFRPCG